MNRPRVRAVVLAAGLGTRLRPLTDTFPKPLLPVVGRPLVSHTLSRLRDFGCEAAALNLHHLGTRVRRELGERFGDLPLAYSVEERILGTLGALGPLRQFLEPADLILVVNGDSLCRWPLGGLVRRHVDSGAAATMLFSARAPIEEFGGGVGIDRQDRVETFRDSPADPRREGLRRRVFAGAHLLSPRLLARVPDRRADFISDLYEPLLKEGETIGAVESDEPWHDLGTPARYLEAALAWIPNDQPAGGRRGSWIAGGAELDEGVRIEQAVVESGARIGRESVVERSLVLPGARLGEGCRVRRSIVGPGVELAAGSRLEGSMATAPVGAGKALAEPSGRNAPRLTTIG